MRLLCLFLLFAFSCATKNTLVLLDNLFMKETHSIFFKHLTERGYKLTFRTADDPSLKLSKYGEHLYENLIIFSPSVEEFGGDVSVENIVKFVDNGGNLLVAGSQYSTDTLRDLASEMGFEMDDDGAAVIDHLNFDQALDDGTHTMVVSDNVLAVPVMVGQSLLGPQQQQKQQQQQLHLSASVPLLYRGTGLLLDTSSNQLVMPVLTGSHSTYSHHPDRAVTEEPHVAGDGTVLVAALQARNNARVVFSGSVDFFSDKLLVSSVHTATGRRYERCGNEQLITALTGWLFRQAGVLRAGQPLHYQLPDNLISSSSLAAAVATLAVNNTPAPPPAYTIKQHVMYAIEMEELMDGEWRPYTAADVQLQLVRIDPFVRTRLLPASADGGAWQRVAFQLPDVYGVFKLEVDYRRRGYTHIHSVTQVSVRPLQHTEYERFIEAAYPYYASALSMMVSCVLFACVFLHYGADLQHPTTNVKSKAD